MNTATAARPIEVEMTHTRDTSKMSRYDATDEEAPVANLYVTQDAMQAIGSPERITLTIAPAAD